MIIAGRVCLFALILGVLMLIGCGSSQEPTAEAEPITNVDAQIEKVQNDPNLNDDQKDLYTRQLEARKKFDAQSSGQGDAYNVRPGN